MTKVGEHIILEIIGTTTEYDPSVFEKVINEIAKAAKVTILNISKYKFEPQGFTILALLAESHISFHTFPEKGIPSSEWKFHQDIYRNKKEAKAIVHAHSTCATAVSTHKRGIPSFHYMVAMAGGHDIKCAKYATFGTRELSKNILKALKGRKACLISNHGQIAFEESLSKAFELAEEVENISLQYITSLKLGKPKILSINEMKKVLSKAKNYKRG